MAGSAPHELHYNFHDHTSVGRAIQSLWTYGSPRNTPHSTTKESPAMLFMRRKLRSRLDLLKPSAASRVEKVQEAQCAHRDIHAKARKFQVGDKVLVRDYGRGGEKWTPGVVSAETGPVSYSRRRITRTLEMPC